MMRIVLIVLFGLVGTSLAAQDCAKGLLFSTCESAASLRLRILPDDPAGQADLEVAGTYSSGDRFGIEGVAIRDGEVISRRFQRWDGVLVIKDGQPSIHRATSVPIDSEVFNIKVMRERNGFLAAAKAQNLSVLQSHLLISDGKLDLRNVEDAPEFVRRLLFTTTDGGFGVFQTDAPMTLYEAAVALMENHAPLMALNLDMGAYDYCVKDQTDCGNLLVPFEKLTNILEFSHSSDEAGLL